MSAKHTAGPWFVSNGLRGRVMVRSEAAPAFADGTRLAVAQVMGGAVGDEQLIANAHLIAAAPELLQACMVLVYDLTYATGKACLDQSLAVAQAAIEKAKGQKVPA